MSHLTLVPNLGDEAKALGKTIKASEHSISGGAVKALTEDQPARDDYAGLAIELFDALTAMENTMEKISQIALLSIDNDQSLKNVGALANSAIENVQKHLNGVNIDNTKTRRIKTLEAALQDGLDGLNYALRYAAEVNLQMPLAIVACQKTVEHALTKNARITQDILGGE